MGEPIANTGYSLKITPLSGTASQQVNGIPIPDPTIKVGNSPIIGMTLPFVASGCTFPPNNHISGGGVIVATSINKFNNLPVLRKGDKGVCTGSFISPPPANATIPCSCMIEIDDAGQSNAKSD